MICVVNVVRKQRVFRGRKMRQLFQLYFWAVFERGDGVASPGEPTIVPSRLYERSPIGGPVQIPCIARLHSLRATCWQELLRGGQMAIDAAQGRLKVFL